MSKNDKGLSTRQHIVDKATGLFSEAGYDATSIETILTASEVSRGALYHHFKSKEQLFEAVFEAIEARMTAAAVAASRSIADPAAGLRAACALFLQPEALAQVRQIVLVDAPAVLGWAKWREIEARHGLGVLKAGLTAAAEARGLADGPVEQMAHLLLAALIEAALLVTRADDPQAASRASIAAVNKVIDGILS